MKAKLVQEKWVNWDNPGYDKVGNIQLSRLMNADVRLDSSGFGIEHKATLKRLTEEVVAEGGRPYYIPAGASDHPLGGLGFAAVGIRGPPTRGGDGPFLQLYHCVRHHRLYIRWHDSRLQVAEESYWYRCIS